MVELASQPGDCVAQIARENGVNDNVIFKWLRLWQNEGRVSRRLPVTTSSDTFPLTQLSQNTAYCSTLLSVEHLSSVFWRKYYVIFTVPSGVR